MYHAAAEKIQEQLTRLWETRTLPHAIAITGSGAADIQGIGSAFLDVVYTGASAVGYQMQVAPTGKDITIEQIRACKEFLLTTADAAHPRWVVIQDAQQLSPSAANALLKVLEEPPAHSYFMLLSTAWESVLPTISSRVSVYRVYLDVEAITRHPSYHTHRELFDVVRTRPLHEARQVLEPLFGEKDKKADHAVQRRLLAQLLFWWHVYARELLRSRVGSGGDGLAVVRALKAIRRARHDISRNIHPKLLFETLLFALYDNDYASNT